MVETGARDCAAAAAHAAHGAHAQLRGQLVALDVRMLFYHCPIHSPTSGPIR
jgi:hypothetical protein